MKKITLMLFAFLSVCFLWQVDAQTIMGSGNPQTIPATGTGGFPCVGGPSISPADASAITGVIGTGNGDYTIDNVTVNIDHTWASDIEMELISPAGTTLQMMFDDGGSTGFDTAADAVFTDSSTNDPEDWETNDPIPADFFPEGGLMNTVFAGESIAGDWTISICDDAGGDSGNLNSYSITFSEIMVVGNPPVIGCPMDIIANNDVGLCEAVVDFAITAVDVEDGNLTGSVMQTMGLPSGSMFPVGDTMMEFSVTDSDGNTVSCGFTVTVEDGEMPMAVCQDLTLEVDPVTGTVSITPMDVDNGSTDNCGIDSMTLSQSTFTCADIGDVAVTLTVFDEAGNSSDCMATITIEDNTAPVIFCEGAIGPSSGSTSDSPALDIVDNTTVTTTIDVTDDETITDLDVLFDIEHTWVGDVEMTLTSPAGTSVLVFSGGADGCSGDNIMDLFDDESANVLDCQAGTADAFPEADYMPSNPLSAFDGESTLGTWTLDIEDTAGGDPGVLNMWALNYSFDPTVATPVDVILDAMGNATIDASTLILSVDEACTWVATVGGPATGGGTTNESLETTFVSNNGFNANWFDVMAINTLTINSFDINMDTGVTDDVEVWMRPGSYVGFESDPTGWTLMGTAVGITSAGTDLPTPLNLNLGAVVNAGETVAFHIATVNGGSINYTNGGTVGDLFASDANLEFYEGAGGDGPFGGSVFSPRVWNGNINYSVGPAVDTSVSFDCSQLGENQVEVFVTDSAGNFSSCIATVNVIDETAPVITCGADPTVTASVSDSPALDIVDNTTVMTTLNVAEDEMISDLNIDLDITHSWVGDMEITLTSPAGTSAVIFSGGVDGCSANDLVATLDDESANALDCDPAGVGSDGEAFPEADYAPSNPLSVFDGESTMGDWTLSIEDTATGDPGVVNTWGLTYSYQGPATNFIIELDENGEATVDPADFISSMDEACGIVTYAADQTEFSCDDIGGVITLTVFVSDASDNIASCMIDVEVVDLLGPVIECPADQTVDPGPGNTFYEVPDYFATGEATATDNCTDPVTVTTQDPAPGTLIPDGVYTVTLTAEDEYGNPGTCSFELTVESILGVNDNALSNGVSMYPNPANDQFTISNSSNIALERAVIFDVNGKLINTIDLRDMNATQTVNVSNLAAGVYMVQISGEQASVVKRLIKE